MRRITEAVCIELLTSPKKRKARPGVRLNEHTERGVVFQHAWTGADRLEALGSCYRSGRSPDSLKFKNPAVPAMKREVEEDRACYAFLFLVTGPAPAYA